MRTRIGLGIAFLLASTACTGSVFTTPDAGPTPGDDGGAVPPNGGGGAKDSGSDAGSDAASVDAAPPPGCDVTKLPTEDACVVDDAVGVFVSSSMGSASGDGTKAKPFASLDAAIAAAKTAHKRVYACADVYAEQVHLADKVDVFGYFACSASWAVVTTAHAKVAAPASPAAMATDITDATRVEAVDLVAPDYKSGAQSSIALIASNSPALTIKSATIHAGTGGNGADGADGIQLLDSGSAKNGGDAVPDHVCAGVMCVVGAGGAGGTNTCTGATGHDGGAGGAGGNGGEYQSQFFYNGYVWNSVGPSTSVGLPTSPTSGTAQGGGFGTGGSPGAPGGDGKDGYAGVDFGGLSVSGGYSPSDGTNGTDGAPGQGGGGSGGNNALSQDFMASSYQNAYAWGESGAGGGAGGCPGLAGTGGKGGGASIAIVAEQSPFTLDHVTIESSAGGAGGSAGSASSPIVGGAGGNPGVHTVRGGAGGKGGYAGVSGNGGGGPSIGIAYQGTVPQQLATTIAHGAGGAGVAARVGKDGKTIPASMNGQSVDVYVWGA